jgi:hypothetical protein
MTDVVVIAGVVAYFRASVPAEVEVRVGAWCYLLVAGMILIGDRTLNRRASGTRSSPTSRRFRIGTWPRATRAKWR